MAADFNKMFRLDEATGKLFWASPPRNHAEKLGLEAGYVCIGKGKNKSYWQIRAGGATFKRGRVIFYMLHGRWPEPCLDHINGDSLDDRPSNLREATRQQNAQNMAPKRGKASGLPLGVSRYKHGYRAQITLAGQRKLIGFFADPSIAAAAYQSHRKELFGDFA